MSYFAEPSNSFEDMYDYPVHDEPSFGEVVLNEFRPSKFKVVDPAKVHKKRPSKKGKGKAPAPRPHRGLAFNH